MHFQLPHLRDSDAHQARDQGENAWWHEGLGQEADGKAQGKAGRKGTEHGHTILFSEVTLDKIGHRIWAHGKLGEGLDHMWSEYEQIPMSPFWEKFKKLLFTIKSAPD